jgi:Major tropism determinant N-terminal domain
MSQQFQLRRGTAAEIAAFTPAVGEPVYNTTTKMIHVGDGITAGGMIAVGTPGKSAYQAAVDDGFVGSQKEWLNSLQGISVKGDPGKDGFSMLSTNGPPAPSLGKDGDFANDSTNMVMYGPKSAGWPAGKSYKGADGTPAATKFLRNFATRCRTQGGQTAASQHMYTKSWHVNRGDDITNPQLVFSNWWATYQGEFAGTTAAQIRASIEVDPGRRVQATWQNATTGTIQPGTNSVSDPIQGVTIRRGQGFWVHNIYDCAAGILTSSTAALDRTVNGPAEIGFGSAAVMASDWTMATYTGSSTSSGYFPSAIIGMSSVASVMVIGDSRCGGLQDSPAGHIGLSGAGDICPSLDAYLPYCNMGSPTDQGQTFLAQHTLRGSIAQYHTHLHCQYSVNDFSFNQSLTQMKATLNGIWNWGAGLGMKISQSTIEPKVASTDLYLTQGAMTPSVLESANIEAINAWIMTKPNPVLQNVFDVASVVRNPVNPQKWKTPDGDTYWDAYLNILMPVTAAATGDGTHLSPFFYEVVRRSKIIDTSLMTL